MYSDLPYPFYPHTFSYFRSSSHRDSCLIPANQALHATFAGREGSRYALKPSSYALVRIIGTDDLFQCDQTRPGCVRCEKLGKPCPGYREEDDLMFRNENVASYETNRTRDRRRTPADLSLAGTSDSSPSSRKGSVFIGAVGVESTQFEMNEKEASTVFGANTTFIPPCPQIQDPWKMYSITLLLNQFSSVLEGERYYWGLDFLPDLYQEASEESCLVLATNAFTRAYIANQSRASTYTNELAQIYGKALASTNAALADPLRCVQDDTIMAVWLLANHEVSGRCTCLVHKSNIATQILVASPNQKPVPAPHAWHVHTQGLTSLLRLRGPGQFFTSRGRKIFYMMYNIIVSLILQYQIPLTFNAASPMPYSKCEIPRRVRGVV